MENRGYSIDEVGILGGNDKGKIKFILFLMSFTNGILCVNIVIDKVFTLPLKNRYLMDKYDNYKLVHTK